ncbi:hypothetical protein FE257_011111 [Aspergillus nanangensis]|uniref:Zn(2)-C6 fungal-type domain-containing protein n=1 Tax=Aspergillus nanangensis TaxID=2582783 RepID=A0AAD4CHT2_ASPNN|nr:hypothetical protein FE257_011111 [Aspergillus nanangensis]
MDLPTPPQRLDMVSGPPVRKRARQSCETCKTRKTRCVGGETGACEYCQSMGIACEVNLRSRKRPFYKVSEEVFDYSIKLLRRFVPEEELPDLTVRNIQEILDRLDRGPPASVSPINPVGAAPEDEPPCLPAQEVGASHEEMGAEEHPILREEMGCLVLDSMKKYRYVGADSSLRWNHAARIASERPGPIDPRIIRPLKTGLLPPATPDDIDTDWRKKAFLPCRQICMHYVARFFEHIHPMYWFYSSEQFFSLLDQTLDNEEFVISASWLCSLYCIFALGSLRPRDKGSSSTVPGIPEDAKSATEYLQYAKELSLAVAEEADIDSVRAFGLLSLTMHAMCYSTAAYLHIGTAVRIAFSLGLHHDIFPKTTTSVERERARRVWWTIYTLDYEMASRFGYPCSIVEEVSFMTTSPASEILLDPGPHMPLGYQALSVTLIRLRKKITLDCFLEPTHSGGRLPINRVANSLGALGEWLETVPHHLHWNSALPPQHRRSAGLLHLRYLTCVISITRPFLLFSVARSSDIRLPEKKKCYDELSSVCIDSAEKMVQVITKMRETQTLSSVTLHDCQSIGEVIWVFILALRRRQSSIYQQMLRFCLNTLSEMEKFGWCEKVVPEFEARVYESGVLEGDSGLLGLSSHDIPADVAGPNSMGSQLGDLDVFETLDLFDSRASLMDIFAQGSLEGSLDMIF